MKYRVGIGYDVHALKEGESLILGGIPVEHYKGTVAHSDGDVIIHAIIDALLGATNQRDIGFHFSDLDPEFKNIDSKVLLARTLKLVQQKGYTIGNVDVVICLQKPKLKDSIPNMMQCIARILELDIDDVSIKATTTEKLGFVGQEQGVSCYSVAMVCKNDR